MASMAQPLTGSATPVVIACGIESSHDPGAARLIKPLVFACAIFLALVIVQAVTYVVVLGSVVLAIPILACGSCVPSCGYFGAKRKDRNLLGIYTCCSGFGACSQTSSLFFAGVLLFFSGEILSLLGPVRHCCTELRACDFAVFNGTGGDGSGSSACECILLPGSTVLPAGERNGDGREMYPDGSPICTQDFDNSTTNATVTCLDEETCRLYDAIPDHVTPLLGLEFGGVVFILVLIPLFASCIGCVYGYRLLSRPSYFRVLTPQMPSTQGYSAPAAPYVGQSDAVLGVVVSK